MAPNTPNQAARQRSATNEDENYALSDLYDVEDADDFVEMSPSPPNRFFPRRNCMNEKDVHAVRTAMHPSFYEEDDESDRVYSLDCDVASFSRIGSLLDISGELKLRSYQDEEPWKEDDPWKSKDSLCQLVDQISKTEEQRKQSLIHVDNNKDKAIHPRVSELKRTWRSNDSLCSMIENTTQCIWKSSDSLSNLVEKYSSSSSSSRSSSSKFQSITTSQSDKMDKSASTTTNQTQSSYGSKFNPLGSAKSWTTSVYKRGMVSSNSNSREITVCEDVLESHE